MNIEDGVPPGVGTRIRRPGEWPRGCRPHGRDPREEQLVSEYAAREVFLGVVRADLERQPTPGLARAAGRRWCKRIVQLAEDVATSTEEGTR